MPKAKTKRIEKITKDPKEDYFEGYANANIYVREKSPQFTMSKAVKASFADLAIKQSKKDCVPGPGISPGNIPL